LLRCLSLTDGRTIWERRYPVDVKRNHGMSRTVPAVTDDWVVTIGPKCHVSCVDANRGVFRWGIDLVAEYGAKVPPWYAGQCPLVERDRVILAPGGDALMIAVELATGRVIWKSPNPRKWDMTHSSIVATTFAGRKMYVYCATGGVAGISAEDGAILWDTTAWKVPIATIAAPVTVGEGKLFFSGGYGAGSMLLTLHDSGGRITPDVTWKLPPETFGAEQHTPIFYDGFLYGVIPGGQLVCLDIATGKQRWNSGNTRFGLGAFMINDGNLYLLNDSGTLTIASASPDEFRPLGQWRVIENAHESWGPMALAGGKLLVRDLRRLVCLDLKESAHD
jgi:outer membrane protein assembly factor BamB